MESSQCSAPKSLCLDTGKLVGSLWPWQTSSPSSQSRREGTDAPADVLEQSLPRVSTGWPCRRLGPGSPWPCDMKAMGPRLVPGLLEATGPGRGSNRGQQRRCTLTPRSPVSVGPLHPGPAPRGGAVKPWGKDLPLCVCVCVRMHTYSCVVCASPVPVTHEAGPRRGGC